MTLYLANEPAVKLERPRPTPDDFYHGPLAGTHFEYRVLSDDGRVVLTTTDSDAYDNVRDRFPEDLGYVHEAREMTAWLPESEVGTSLVPKRNLIWKMLEQVAEGYERQLDALNAQVKNGNRGSLDALQAYQRAAGDIRGLIRAWRDNY